MFSYKFYYDKIQKKVKHVGCGIKVTDTVNWPRQKIYGLVF